MCDDEDMSRHVLIYIGSYLYKISLIELKLATAMTSSILVTARRALDAANAAKLSNHQTVTRAPMVTMAIRTVASASVT